VPDDQTQVTLSDFLIYHFIDPPGRRARLIDLAVDLAKNDYPLVKWALVRWPGNEERQLPWEAVREIDWQARQVSVVDLDAVRQATPTALQQAVLLRRDVRDALVLDLENRQATRANDLWLTQDGGRLLLHGADVSPWAVLRRLGHGLFSRARRGSMLDWKNVEFLRGDPRRVEAGGAYHRRVERLSAVEIAHLVDQIPYLHATELLKLCPDGLAADAQEEMSPERQLQIFEELDEDHAVRLLALMAPNAAADLVGRLEPHQAQRYLNKLPPERGGRIVELLRYPEDTAGGIMTNEVVAVPGSLTVDEARQALGDQLTKPDFVYYVYIVGDEQTRRLRGVLTLRDFFLADEKRRLEEVMNPRLVTIDPFESADEAARRVAENGVAALPVVTPEGNLVGAVTFDAAIAQITPPGWRDQVPRVFS